MKSLAELQAIRDKMRRQIDLRDSGDDRIRVVVGMGCSTPFWRRLPSGS